VLQYNNYTHINGNSYLRSASELIWYNVQIFLQSMQNDSQSAFLHVFELSGFVFGEASVGLYTVYSSSPYTAQYTPLRIPYLKQKLLSNLCQLRYISFDVIFGVLLGLTFLFINDTCLNLHNQYLSLLKYAGTLSTFNLRFSTFTFIIHQLLLQLEIKSDKDNTMKTYSRYTLNSLLGQLAVPQLGPPHHLLI